MPTSPALLARLDRTGVPLLLARLFVGGMFAYLSYQKLIGVPEFLKQLHGYQFFPTTPPELINTIAIVVPWLEMLCAAALVLGIFIRGSAATIIAMLLFFYPLLILRALGLLHDPSQHFASFCDVKFDCGCGTGVVYICPKLAENTALLLGALIALLSRSRRWCLEGLCCRRQAATLAPSASTVVTAD